MGALRTAIAGALAAGCALTDECSAMEWAGEAPLLVQGAEDNIKVTRPDDLALAAQVLCLQETVASVAR